MRKLLNSKLFLVALSFVAGAVATNFFKENFHFTYKKGPSQIEHVDALVKQFDQFFDKRLLARPRNSLAIPKGLLGLGIAQDFVINHSENDEYKMLKISSQALRPEEIEVEVSEGMISISGVVKTRKTGQNQNFLKSSTLSRFSKSFNVPYGVDEAGVSINTDGNELIIKFPKLNS